LSPDNAAEKVIALAKPNNSQTKKSKYNNGQAGEARGRGARHL